MGRITTSSFFKFIALKARFIAAVPLEQEATNLQLKFFLILSSNFLTIGPVVKQFLVNEDFTDKISSLSTN